jgi:predicted nuclease of predicted toxin-antitoxin system
MSLAFLLDENLPMRVVRAIQRFNLTADMPIDALRVGDVSELPLGADDQTVLLWAESAGRILVSEDKHTLPDHLDVHLAMGRHCPGVFLVRPGIGLLDVVEFLSLVAHLTEPFEWRDRVSFIP